MSSTGAPVSLSSTIALWDTKTPEDPGSRNYTLSQDSQIASSAFLLFNLPCGLLGNGCICWFVVRNKALRTPTCLMICNLAMAGLIQSLVCAPLLLFFTFVYTGSIVQDTGSHGDKATGVVVVCYTQAFLRYVSGHVILFTTVCIAHERYHAIAKPFDKVVRSKRVRVTIPLTWISATVLGLIGTAVFFDSMEYALCHHYVPDTAFGLETQFGTFFMVPVGLLSVVLIMYHYSAMLWLVRKHLTSFRTKNLFSRSNKNKVKPITEDLQLSKATGTNVGGETKVSPAKAKPPGAGTTKTHLPAVTTTTSNVPLVNTNPRNSPKTKTKYAEINQSDNLPGTLVHDRPETGFQLKGSRSVKSREHCTEVDQFHTAPKPLQGSKPRTTKTPVANTTESQLKQPINYEAIDPPQTGSISDLVDSRCLKPHSISPVNHSSPLGDGLAQGEVFENSQPPVKAASSAAVLTGFSRQQTNTHQSFISHTTYTGSLTTADDNNSVISHDARSIRSLSLLPLGSSRSDYNKRRVVKVSTIAGNLSSRSDSKTSRNNETHPLAWNASLSLGLGAAIKSNSSPDFASEKKSQKLPRTGDKQSAGTSLPLPDSNNSPPVPHATSENQDDGDDKLTTDISRTNCVETGEANVHMSGFENEKQIVSLGKKSSNKLCKSTNNTENSSQACDSLNKNDTSKIISNHLNTDTPVLAHDKSSSVHLVDVYDAEGNVARENAKTFSKQEVVGAVCTFNPKNREKGRRKVEAHTAKMTALAMACFLLCWFPYPTAILVVFVEANNVGYVSDFLFNFYSVSVSLSILAAAVNPLIYGLLNTQFKCEFQRLANNIKIKCKCRERS